MSTSSVGGTTLDNLIASYEPLETETSESDDLGSADFLTLLVAQLENQNPLDPADTDTFTDQLAQYTQVEELNNLNEKMDVLIDETVASGSQINAVDYVGMQVTGNANTMTIDGGSVTSGFYDLAEPAEVTIVIRDDQGNLVTTLDEGQQDGGAYLITWDGTGDDGTSLVDGTYTYTVMANAGTGYEEIPSNITGTVDAVAYQNGEEYLVVGGVLLDPQSLTSMTESGDSESDDATSILDYLGTTVSSNYPIVQVREGQVAGEDMGYYLESPQDVSVTIYDAGDQAVSTIEVPAAETVAGDNQVHWDGLEDSGYQASEGLYYYTVETQDGSALTPVAGEVTGIQYINGSQYLTLGDSGRLVSLSTVSSVQ